MVTHTAANGQAQIILAAIEATAKQTGSTMSSSSARTCRHTHIMSVLMCLCVVDVLHLEVVDEVQELLGHVYSWSRGGRIALDKGVTVLSTSTGVFVNRRHTSSSFLSQRYRRRIWCYLILRTR